MRAIGYHDFVFAFMVTALASMPCLAAESGEQLYLENCAACHRSDGKGIANVYPALAGSEVVLDSGIDVALVLIIGRGEMPSFNGTISSTDMASIINYVRNAWGNAGQPVSAQTIESLR